VDRFLSGVAPVPPPRAAICSKTSRREASSQPPRSWGSSRSQFETPAPLGVNAQATAKVLRVVLERDGCALGAHVKDVHNPALAAAMFPLGAMCRMPIGLVGDWRRSQPWASLSR